MLSILWSGHWNVRRRLYNTVLNNSVTIIPLYYAQLTEKKNLINVPLDSKGPSFRFWNISPVRFLFSLSLYSSARVEMIKKFKFEKRYTYSAYFLHIIYFTWIWWQVLEVHWLTDFSIRGPPELHLDSHWLSEVSVTVGRCAKHNGHLPVDISLGESALPLPGVLEETHLDVLCRETKMANVTTYCSWWWTQKEYSDNRALTRQLRCKSSSDVFD